METIRKIKVEITIAGANVTADVSPYLSRISYADRVEAESDSIDLVFDDVAKLWQTDWYPQQGDSLTVKMGYVGDLLDCGVFEIDEIQFDTPPDTLTVRALAAAISKSLRTKNSKAFEKQTLLKIAQYFADKHGLKIVGSATALNEVEIERKTQENQTDLGFLAGIAKEFGFVFSVRGDQLVFMDMVELEKKPAVMEITPKMLSKCSLKDKTAQTYGGAVIAKRNARTNTVMKYQTGAAEYSGDTLVINDSNADNDKAAEARTRGALKEKNKDKITGSFTMEGNAAIVAGINITLSGYGQFSGKWHVVETRHTIDPSGGYTTDATIRKIV